MRTLVKIAVCLCASNWLMAQNSEDYKHPQGLQNSSANKTEVSLMYTTTTNAGTSANYKDQRTNKDKNNTVKESVVLPSTTNQSNANSKHPFGL